MDIQTKCKIAKALKKSGLFSIGGLSVLTIIEAIISFPVIKSEIHKLVNGDKGFFEISKEAQRFLIVLALLFMGMLIYVTGRRLYKKWVCWRIYGKT